MKDRAINTISIFFLLFLIIPASAEIQIDRTLSGKQISDVPVISDFEILEMHLDSSHVTDGYATIEIVITNIGGPGSGTVVIRTENEEKFVTFSLDYFETDSLVFNIPVDSLPYYISASIYGEEFNSSANCQLREPTSLDGMKMSVWVYNAGDRYGCDVEWYLDGKWIATSGVGIAPGKSKKISNTFSCAGKWGKTVTLEAKGNPCTSPIIDGRYGAACKKTKSARCEVAPAPTPTPTPIPTPTPTPTECTPGEMVAYSQIVRNSKILLRL
jgi:hypothetical protein